MNKRRYRTLTKEFKLEAIALTENSEKGVVQIERELGITTGLLAKWRHDTRSKMDLSRNWSRAIQGRVSERFGAYGGLDVMELGHDAGKGADRLRRPRAKQPPQEEHSPTSATRQLILLAARLCAR